MLDSCNFDSKAHTFVIRLHFISIASLLFSRVFSLDVLLFFIVDQRSKVSLFLIRRHLEGLDFRRSVLVRTNTVYHDFVFVDIIHKEVCRVKSNYSALVAVEFNRKYDCAQSLINKANKL